MGMTEEQRVKNMAYLAKAKKAGYSDRVLIMTDIMAFSSDNVGHEIETLDKFIDLIDKYPDEQEFFYQVCYIFGIE